nr:MAG TPA: hypothetical protein [Caudoviricetes sp.]
MMDKNIDGVSHISSFYMCEVTNSFFKDVISG